MSSHADSGLPMVRAALAGAGAYLLGVGLVVGTSVAGLHPAGGVWGRMSGTLGYLLVHQTAHLPVWQFAIQWAVLPYTVVLFAVLVGTGLALAIQEPTDPIRVGQGLAVGYAPLAFGASVALVLTHGAVTAFRMVAPTVLVGIVVPALFGTLGGVIAARVTEQG